MVNPLRRSLRVAVACVLVASISPAAALDGAPSPIVAGEAFRGFGAAATPDGRHVVFHTAQRLSAADVNDAFDVYHHDASTGVTTLVSAGPGGQAGNDHSAHPDVSADGRYVVFESRASDLLGPPAPAQCRLGVSGTATRRLPCWQVYVADLEQGTVALVHDTRGDVSQFAPAISGDGRVVAFHTHRVTRTLDAAFESVRKVVAIVERATGTVARVHPTRVPVPGTDDLGLPESSIDWLAPDLSHDGRYVVFASEALPIADSGAHHPSPFARVYLYDREGDRLDAISDPPGTLAEGISFLPRISGDGGRVAFFSSSQSLVAGDTNVRPDVFVWERASGSLRRVSVTSAGGESPDGVAWDWFENRMGLGISADGGTVVFSAPSALDGAKGNCSRGYAHPCLGVFVHDLDARLTTEVGVPPDGDADGDAWAYAVSDGGRHVLFASDAADLLPGSAPPGWALHRVVRARELGAEDVQIEVADDALTVAGATRWPAATTGATDPADDALGSLASTGAELTGASVVSRPYRGDVLAVWHLREAPGVPVAHGEVTGRGLHDPSAVAVTASFSHAGSSYRIEGRWVPGTDAPGAAPTFRLLRCAAGACSPVDEVAGSIGSTGAEALAAVPLSLLGAAPGGQLVDVAFGTEVAGVPADGVAVGDVSLPVPRGRITLRTPDGIVAGEAPLELFEARFAGTVGTEGVTGDAVAVIELCLATRCGTTDVPVTLG